MEGNQSTADWRRVIKIDDASAGVRIVRACLELQSNPIARIRSGASFASVALVLQRAGTTGCRTNAAGDLLAALQGTVHDRVPAGRKLGLVLTMTQRTKVFISYSHDDVSLLKAVRKQLAVLEREGLLDVFEDGQIEGGEDWYERLDDEMASASVGLLLISASFLGSAFIRKEEVPRLFDRHAEGGMSIFPLLVSACAWQQVSWLSRLQMRPRDANRRPRAVNLYRGAAREQVLAEVAGEIAQIVRRSGAVGPNDDPAPPNGDMVRAGRLPRARSAESRAASEPASTIHFGDIRNPDRISISIALESVRAGRSACAIAWPESIEKLRAAANGVLSDLATPARRPVELARWSAGEQAGIAKLLSAELKASTRLLEAVPLRFPDLAARLMKWVTVDDALEAFLALSAHRIWYPFARALRNHLPLLADAIVPADMRAWMSRDAPSGTLEASDRAAYGKLFSLDGEVCRARIHSVGGVVVACSAYGLRSDLLRAYALSARGAFVDTGWARVHLPAQVEVHLLENDAGDLPRYDGNIEISDVLDASNRPIEA